MQYLIQRCASAGKMTEEVMCYEIRRAEACVDLSDHHTLVNAGERDSVWNEGGEKKGSACEEKCAT